MVTRSLFPTTSWTIIKDVRGDRCDARVAALDRLIAIYWRPVYLTLRLDWGAPPQDARDLTQDYFAHLLEPNHFDRLAPEHGTFRSWVKATLKNFVRNRRRDQVAFKRGGRCRIVALDDLAAVE